MMIERLDNFLSQPAKVRYSIIISGFILLNLIVYYLVISPLNQQLQNDRRSYYSLLDDIELLDNKLMLYPSREQLIAHISDLKQQYAGDSRYSVNQLVKIISQQLLNNQLQLIDFEQKTDGEQAKLDFKIKGDYLHFIKFMTQLAELDLTINVMRMSVIRQTDDPLFLLSISEQTKQREKL